MGISQTDIAAAVEAFIRGAFHVVPGENGLTRQAHLYESGLVDSAGVVELISFVESTFNVKLEDEDIFADAFTTIDGISSVVHMRVAQKNGS